MIVPAKGHLLIQPVEVKETTASGIYVPVKTQDKQAIGTVLRAAEDLKEYEGAQVYYSPYAATEIKDNILIRVEDIIAYEVDDAELQAASETS